MEAWPEYSSACLFKMGATRTEGPFHHKFRSRQIFGVAKDFCPNFPKFTRKFFVQLLRTNSLPQRSLGPVLVRPPKKVFTYFSANLGCHFLK